MQPVDVAESTAYKGVRGPQPSAAIPVSPATIAYEIDTGPPYEDMTTEHVGETATFQLTPNYVTSKPDNKEDLNEEGEGKIVYVGDYDYGEASVRMTEDILNDQFPWKAKSANAAVERVVEPVTDNLNEETALKTASAPFLNAPNLTKLILDEKIPYSLFRRKPAARNHPGDISVCAA
ncbi:unnamed protein product [Enterobius vermicularis]|uniref:Organ specific protein n=1 Tax=Enterobius vermicularis TaxID=51028 RepID=A0A0N4VKP0_ENTVE|nr:unnamed protein product [Enterobius vermicularis]